MFQRADVIKQLRLHNNHKISAACRNNHVFTDLIAGLQCSYDGSAQATDLPVGWGSTCLSVFWDQQAPWGMFFSQGWQKPKRRMWKLTTPCKSCSQTAALTTSAHIPLAKVSHKVRPPGQWVAK